MMKPTRFARSARVLAMALLLVLAACAPTAEAPGDDETAPAPAGKVYGTQPALSEPIAIADLLATPEEFVGKTVQIKGTAIHVCKHSGKRLQLAQQDADVKIMVDFSEAGLEFPAETLNHMILAEGTLIRRDLGAAPKEEDHEHAAPEEGGESGEACAAEEAGADETRHVYVIAGTGALDLDLAG